MKKLISFLSLAVVLTASFSTYLKAQVNPYGPVYGSSPDYGYPAPGVYINPYLPGAYNPSPPGVYINPAPHFYGNPYRIYPPQPMDGNPYRTYPYDSPKVYGYEDSWGQHRGRY
jgi:hypothetical protein